MVSLEAVKGDTVVEVHVEEDIAALVEEALGVEVEEAIMDRRPQSHEYGDKINVSLKTKRPISNFVALENILKATELNDTKFNIKHL